MHTSLKVISSKTAVEHTFSKTWKREKEEEKTPYATEL